MNSTALHAILRDLESTAEKTGGTLTQQEAQYRSALRRAVEEQDATFSIAAESALEEARREHSRATASLEVARQLLADVLRREKAEARDKARAEIEAKLAEMAMLAAEADGHTAALVGLARRILAAETALHSEARQAFDQVPWRAPQALSALRSIASYLTAAANGLEPDVRPFVAETVAGAAQNIRGAMQP